jgi:YidC/Oxa1 family membrane protein insertase
MILASTIGQIFQPLFRIMAEILSFFYALVPNYAVAITLLTLAVMAVTAPLTVKSTRSMVAMQRLAPELKKLQQKYKGDRQQLNEEMMKLYREHNVSPAGGCLPMIIQIPVFIILYDVIRGLTNTIRVRGRVVPAPRYIAHSTLLYHNLLHAGGKMESFGINLAVSVLAHHASLTSALPYWGLLLAAIAFQYLQINQINRRNPQLAQANPQAQMMQKYMPILFAVFYLYFPAGVTVYFVVSSLSRIAIQEVLFRTGLIPSGTGPVTRTQAKKRRPSLFEKLADMQKRITPQPPPPPTPPVRRPPRGGTRGEGEAVVRAWPKPRAQSARSTDGTGRGQVGNGAGAGIPAREGSGQKPHPRARDKKPRRAR